jgi:diadenosine tetraphosphate (Ap4A) HIT family hydrolase
MDKGQILEETTLSLAFFDGFPLTPGHILVVPRRHTASFFALSPEEQADLIQLANRCKILLDEKYDPAGYNLGINDGPLAGQTVPHVHLHLIPRYEGDVEDPRGGIRWVIPEKAVYWEDEKE